MSTPSVGEIICVQTHRSFVPKRQYHKVDYERITSLTVEPEEAIGDNRLSLAKTQENKLDRLPFMTLGVELPKSLFGLQDGLLHAG